MSKPLQDHPKNMTQQHCNQVSSLECPGFFSPFKYKIYIYINIYISFLAEVSTVFITQRKMWLWMMKYPDTKVLGTLLAEAPPEEELQILCFAVQSSS